MKGDGGANASCGHDRGIYRPASTRFLYSSYKFLEAIPISGLNPWFYWYHCPGSNGGPPDPQSEAKRFTEFPWFSCNIKSSSESTL
jgi:hypothetical protein